MSDHRLLDTPTRVLCVGSDTYLTDLLRYVLRREGYAVQVAASGGEAAAIAARWRPRAAIVDGDLPDMVGEDLGSLLRERYNTALLQLPVRDVGDGQRVDRTQAGSHQPREPFSLHALVWTLNALLQPAARRLEAPRIRGPAGERRPQRLNDGG